MKIFKDVLTQKTLDRCVYDLGFLETKQFGKIRDYSGTMMLQ